MPNRAARRTPSPVPPAEPSPSPVSDDLQVDVNRVLTIYSDRLAQATQSQIIAEAAKDQVLEENGALRARIAELEAAVSVPDANETPEQ